MKTKLLIQELVLGFAFLEGLWIHVGISPEVKLWRALETVIALLGFNFGPLALMFSIAGILVGLLASFVIGGYLGLIAIAFVAGVFISPFSMLLLFLAILLGGVAVASRD